MTTFALLGDDDQSLALASAVVNSPDHRLVWAGDIVAAERLRQIAPDLTSSDEWAALLSETIADVVIVGRSNDLERRDEQLKRLVQAGIPIIASHPLCESTLAYFELDMIRRDTSCIMLPYLPERWHPVIARLAQWTGAGNTNTDDTNTATTDTGDTAPLGQIQQCSFSRSMSQRDKGSVFAQFSRDVDLIRTLCGEVTRIGAMGTPAPDDLPQADSAYANLNLHLTGEKIQLARWAVTPVQTQSGGQIILQGSKGQATIEMPDDGPWSLKLMIDQQQTEERFDEWDPASEALRRIDELRTSAQDVPALVPDWIDASRSLDLAETIEQSLRRGRTIDMHNEVFTEDRTFKGLMGILSCGLLLFGLFAMVLVTILQGVARQFGLNSVAAFLSNWPILLVAILVLFLLLQFFRLALPKSSKAKAEEKDLRPR